MRHEHQKLPMFCDQCEQTAHGTGCTDIGVCGKDPDVESLQKILLYGLKGMSAYKAHARRLGKTDPAVEAFIEEALFATMTNVNFDAESLLAMVLECGKMNLRTMELLNDGHVEALGKPEPAAVDKGIKEGPGILISGHDLLDLKHLLEQTAGKGINVYTHGEMLPGHMYSGLRAFPHFAGHYGGPWQLQRTEFEAFGGPILGHDYGTVAGLPRLLDLGQCNDSYGAIQIALALAKAFNCGVNDLPLTLVLSWFEQKAVAVLLTLLYLGVKGIRIGPALPAFVSPNVLRILQEKFDLQPIGASGKADVAAAMAA